MEIIGLLSMVYWYQIPVHISDSSVYLWLLILNNEDLSFSVIKKNGWIFIIDGVKG